MFNLSLMLEYKFQLLHKAEGV